MRCGSRLFASHCQEEIKENLPLPSGPSGIVGAGGRQWRGWAIVRALNCWHQQRVSSLSPVWSRDLIRSGLQLAGGQTQGPPHSPELVPSGSTRYPNCSPDSIAHLIMKIH